MLLLLAVTRVPISGPSVEVHGLFADVLIVGGICAAVMAVGAVIHRFQKHVVRPVISDAREMIGVAREARAIFVAFRNVDIAVLAAIAAEFRPNSGTTLHDRLAEIDRLVASNNEKLNELSVYAHSSHDELLTRLNEP